LEATAVSTVEAALVAAAKAASLLPRAAPANLFPLPPDGATSLACWREASVESLSRRGAGAAVAGVGTDPGVELGAVESASVAAAAFRDARADNLSGLGAAEAAIVGAGGSVVADSGLTTGIGVTGVSAVRDASAANLSRLGAGEAAMVGAGRSVVAGSGLTTGIGVTGVSAVLDASAANLSLLGAGEFWDGSDMMDS
jgi:hypothetical protein